MKLQDAKRKAMALIAPIDAIELAVRMLEAGGQIKRPAGMGAHEAFFGLDQEDQDAWLRAAHAAMSYWRECIQAAQQPS